MTFYCLIQIASYFYYIFQGKFSVMSYNKYSVSLFQKAYLIKGNKQTWEKSLKN